MIRKVVIAMFTLAASGTGIVALTSIARPIHVETTTGSDSVIAIVVAYGWAGAFWYQCNKLNAVDNLVSTNGNDVVLHRPLLRENYAWDVYQHRELASFRLGRYDKRVPGEGYYKSVEAIAPLWLPFLLLAAYPTIAFVRGPMRRWRRRRKGCCLSCGYDLTGNESGVCPECGEAI